jgi:hypothetical protein
MDQRRDCAASQARMPQYNVSRKNTPSAIQREGELQDRARAVRHGKPGRPELANLRVAENPQFVVEENGAAKAVEAGCQPDGDEQQRKRTVRKRRRYQRPRRAGFGGQCGSRGPTCARWSLEAMASVRCRSGLALAHGMLAPGRVDRHAVERLTVSAGGRDVLVEPAYSRLRGRMLYTAKASAAIPTVRRRDRSAA